MSHPGFRYYFKGFCMGESGLLSRGPELAHSKPPRSQTPQITNPQITNPQIAGAL